MPLMVKYPAIFHVTGLNAAMLTTIFAQRAFMSAQELYDDLKENKDSLIMFMNDILAEAQEMEDD
jgi:mannose/fructose-specific phosphotransferase system component IIA